MWDAAQYLKYAEERSRPFLDLLARVPLQEPRLIADLGCGPGNLTKLLAERWPKARVTGVDSSAEMLEQARTLALPGRLGFVHADIAAWQPEQPLDLIASNATFQWVDDHERLLARLTGMLARGGVLAVQMPYHFDDPSHLEIEAARNDSRWSAELREIGLHQRSVMPIAWYVERLHDLGFAVDAWQTTYVHVLTGDNPVLEWFKGSAIRPFLKRLAGEKREQFLDEAGRRLRRAYPARGGLTLLPFPRIFFVARLCLDRLPCSSLSADWKSAPAS